MYATERQQEILSKSRLDGRVEVRELAELLDVTPETVRRDLTALERRGLLHRVHGGAIPVERLGFEPAVSERESVMAAQKERIAQAALDELPGRRGDHPGCRDDHRPDGRAAARPTASSRWSPTACRSR